MAGSGSAASVIHRSKGLVRCDVTLVSDASGVTTGVVTPPLFGKIVSIRHDGGAAGATPVFTIKDTKSGATLAVLTAAGAATPGVAIPGTLVNIETSTFGTKVASGTSQTDAYKPIYAAGELTVSQTAGGNALTGIVSIIVDEGSAKSYLT